MSVWTRETGEIVDTNFLVYCMNQTFAATLCTLPISLPVLARSRSSTKPRRGIAKETVHSWKLKPAAKDANPSR